MLYIIHIYEYFMCVFLRGVRLLHAGLSNGTEGKLDNCMYTYTYIYISSWVRAGLSSGTAGKLDQCMYTYTYIYICTHIHIYICQFAGTCRARNWYCREAL